MNKRDLSTTNRYTAPALTTGLRILELLAEAGCPLTQTELARRLGLGAAQPFRLLAVLVREGYLMRDAHGAYRLSLKVLAISRRVDPWAILTAVALQPMRDFAARTGRECHLAILDQGTLFVLAQESGSADVSIRIQPGSRHHPLRTASGRLLLSMIPPGEAERHVALAAQKFKQAPPSAAAWKKAIREVSRRGYSTAWNESLQGLLDVSVPVPGLEGEDMVAALASSHFAASASHSRIQKIRKELINTARIIGQAARRGLD